MAWGYTTADKTTEIVVPTIAGQNYFSGSQVFSNVTDSTSTTTGAVTITGGLAVQGNIYGDSVWGAIWNDLADCITITEDTELEPGRAYCFDGKNYYKSSKYLDDGFIGLHSDTAGFQMGWQPEKHQLHSAVAGFVLAYVDKEYKPSTPLTITENGLLTAIKEEDISRNYHKIVATFWKKELSDEWGPENQKVRVNGRMWVKVE